MKIKKKEILRIENIINVDRRVPDDNFKNLLISDLKKLLLDYFELTISPEINIVKRDGKFRVEVFFVADSIKGFQYIKN